MNEFCICVKTSTNMWNLYWKSLCCTTFCTIICTFGICESKWVNGQMSIYTTQFYIFWLLSENLVKYSFIHFKKHGHVSNWNTGKPVYKGHSMVR